MTVKKEIRRLLEKHALAVELVREADRRVIVVSKWPVRQHAARSTFERLLWQSTEEVHAFLNKHLVCYRQLTRNIGDEIANKVSREALELAADVLKCKAETWNAVDVRVISTRVISFRGELALAGFCMLPAAFVPTLPVFAACAATGVFLAKAQRGVLRKIGNYKRIQQNKRLNNLPFRVQSLATHLHCSTDSITPELAHDLYSIYKEKFAQENATAAKKQAEKDVARARETRFSHNSVDQRHDARRQYVAAPGSVSYEAEVVATTTTLLSFENDMNQSTPDDYYHQDYEPNGGTVNPASGQFMTGDFDTSGNPYGFDFTHSY